MLLIVSSYNRSALTINPVASTTAGNVTHWILIPEAHALRVGPGNAASALAKLGAEGLQPVILVTQR